MYSVGHFFSHKCTRVCDVKFERILEAYRGFTNVKREDILVMKTLVPSRKRSHSNKMTEAMAQAMLQEI